MASDDTASPPAVAPGELFLISAPSGAGKNTLMRRAAADHRLRATGQLSYVVSHTTRRPRRREVNGRDYHFVDPETFCRLRDEGSFLEWAEVHGNLYGTAATEVLPRLAAGVDLLHDLDVQGAERLVQRLPSAHTVFVLPPSYAELVQRLTGRGQDDAATVARRLAVSRWEIERYKMYTYVIINRDAELAAAALAAIILDKRQRRERMAAQVEGILRDFAVVLTPSTTSSERPEGSSI